LLAPLRNVREQLPKVVNRYLEHLSRYNKVSRIPASVINCLFGNGDSQYQFSGQRFDFEDLPEFLRSFYSSADISNPLTVPTRVALAKGTMLRLPLSDKKIGEMKTEWEKLGAKVDVYGDQNHWFSGKWYTGPGETIQSLGGTEIAEMARNEFRQK